MYVSSFHFQRANLQLPSIYKAETNNQIPLMSISCSSAMGSPLIGSVPFSAIYFSINLLSKTQLEEGETQGCSGTSLLTANKII